MEAFDAIEPFEWLDAVDWWGTASESGTAASAPGKAQAAPGQPLASPPHQQKSGSL